jgi:molybdenum cofactor synthesis domain-containing protein
VRVTGRPLPKPRLDRSAPLRVEIVSIGRELLRGRVPDGNAPKVAEHLTGLGAVVHRITVVDDSRHAVAAALTESLARGSRFVVTTGGLGPGADDRTLEAISEALSRPLTEHPGARRLVEATYRRLRQDGLVSLQGMNAAREKMCVVPVGGEPIANPIGPAPGILIRLPGGVAVLALPGVPEEAQAVLREALSLVRDLFAPGFTAQREVESPTKDESALRPLLDRLTEEFPGVAIKSRGPSFARDSGVVVTLEATGPSRREAESTVESALRRLLALAGAGQ